MIQIQGDGIWLHVAKHETQAWYAYIQPEAINLKSNQTWNPNASSKDP